jgi:rhomboid protease GluP
MTSLHTQLRQVVPELRLTPFLIVVNVLVFLAMLLGGAGLWHYENGVQLAWGANFGPATQDGEWWRLGSALFLHFGLLHLALNMWALWDVGQWVERMFGHLRFAVIYFLAGVAGNLLSLVAHSGPVVSGGASGAVFGVYGALLSFLWLERSRIQQGEFRWLFWAAIGFSVLTIVFGLLIPGIDNAAHIGGLVSGILLGIALIRQELDDTSRAGRGLSALLFVLFVAVMIARIPTPAYRWSEETQLRQAIGEFMRDDAAISQEWESLMRGKNQGTQSFDELARQIDAMVADRYQESFEDLSSLPHDAALPSTATVDKLQRYAERRRDASRDLADGIRMRDRKRVEEALERARKSAQGQ